MQDPLPALRTLEVIEDLHASIYRAVGVSPKQVCEIKQPPLFVARDGLGRPIEAMFG